MPYPGSLVHLTNLKQLFDNRVLCEVTLGAQRRPVPGALRMKQPGLPCHRTCGRWTPLLGILARMDWTWGTHFQPLVCFCLDRPLPLVCPSIKWSWVPQHLPEILLIARDLEACREPAWDSAANPLLQPRFSKHCWREPWMHWSS